LEQTTIQWTHDHIHLRCRDVETTARFYGEMFVGVVFRRPGGGPTSITEVDLAGVKLFLSPAPAEDALEPEIGRSRLGVWQLSFRVEDLDAAVTELKGKGAAFTKPAVVLASGARAAFFEGPDGVEIELIQRPPKAARKIGHESSRRQHERRDK
jgi:catechol 2,3-dioxygenase-like lactoylglutathione lyase family enzyme